MQIACRRVASQKTNQCLYSLLVAKPPGLMSEYLVSLTQHCGGLLADWYSPAQRQQAWMMEFYDLQALYDLHQRSRFDIYTQMHYTAAELEEFFVAGLGPIAQDFMQQQGQILFWAAIRAASGRYYNYLLKKHTAALDCLYRTDIQKESGLYVIETRWKPRPSREGESTFLARGRPVTALPAVAV